MTDDKPLKTPGRPWIAIDPANPIPPSKVTMTKTYPPGVEDLRRELQRQIVDHFETVGRDLKPGCTPKMIREAMTAADRGVAHLRRQLIEIENLASFTLEIVHE